MWNRMGMRGIGEYWEVFGKGYWGYFAVFGEGIGVFLYVSLYDYVFHTMFPALWQLHGPIMVPGNWEAGT